MKRYYVLLRAETGSPAPPVINIDAERRISMADADDGGFLLFYTGDEVVAEIRCYPIQAVWED